MIYTYLDIHVTVSDFICVMMRYYNLTSIKAQVAKDIVPKRRIREEQFWIFFSADTDTRQFAASSG